MRSVSNAGNGGDIEVTIDEVTDVIDKLMATKDLQEVNLLDLIHKSLELKQKYNTEYLKKIANHLPTELTESHSLVTTGDLPSTDNEELQKKVNNLYKRINELEVVNDSLRSKVSINEAELLEDTSDLKEHGVELTHEQLKMQRDMLRAELSKSVEHKKKTDQYSMEAKQHAQRLTAENEQLKESLKRVTSEKEQIEATCRDAKHLAAENEKLKQMLKDGKEQDGGAYHASKPKKQHSSSLEKFNDKRTVFERVTGELIEKARLHLVNEEVERKVAERMKQLREKYNEPVKVLSKERSLESAEITSPNDHALNLEVKEDGNLDKIINLKVPLIISSLVIIGLPGANKNNFIKNLFNLYSVNYQPSWEGRDIVLTKIDIKKDKTGKILWEECHGDDCDVLRLILHRVCSENDVSVDSALDELAASDGLSSLPLHNKSFHELINKLKKSSSTSDANVEMYGMSQVFDFSHKSTAFAQIPVLFSDKEKIITILVCEEGTKMYCPRANGEVALSDCVMFWANYLGHFKSDAHNMIVALNGGGSAVSALLSELNKKTTEIGVKNIFQGFIFNISKKNGIQDLQVQLNKSLTSMEKGVKHIKLSYLMFHCALIKISEWPWIPYAIVKQLANIFCISKSELPAVMKFWSSTTSVLYRDIDRLRDIVFCDTVWLATELSKGLNLDPSLSSLLQYGIVEQCVAEKHWLKISSCDGKIIMAGPHQLLLDYFTGFDLATVISMIEGKQHLQCDCYFIPSLLKPCEDSLKENKCSLYVKFPQSFMPMQIFSQIVINLLRDKYLRLRLNKSYLCSNKVSLNLDLCCNLTLVEHRFSVEIIYNCDYCLRPKEEVVKAIRDKVEECCTKSSLEFTFQLMCPNEAHFVRVPDVRTQHVHCQTCASLVPLSNSQNNWVVEQSNLPVKSKDTFATVAELNIEHLVKIAEKINARDAHRLALELGFFDSEYKHISSFGHEKRVILYILITWFDRNEHIRNKHMRLDQALIATGYRALAIAPTDLHVEQRNLIQDSELRMIAEHINRDWGTLAFFCDIDTDDELMERLRQLSNPVDAAYHILKEWNHNYTGGNPRKDLVKHLMKLSLPLVAQHFEQGTLSFYKATANKQFRN